MRAMVPRVFRRSWGQALAALAGALFLAYALAGAKAETLRQVWGLGPSLLLAFLPYTLWLVLDSLAFRRLLEGANPRVGFSTLLRIRLAAEAVAGSIPSASLLSEAVALRLLQTRSGVGIARGGGSLVSRRFLVSLTHALVLIGASSVCLLRAAASSRAPLESSLIWMALAAGVVLLAVAIVAGLALVKGSVGLRIHRLLAAIPSARLSRWLALKQERFQELDDHLAAPLSEIPRLLGSIMGFTLAWIAQGLETFVILWLLGARLPFADAVCLESLVSLLRAVAFFVPGGLGVQDAGYVFALQGLAGPQAATLGAAFVVVKRAKEILFVLIGYGFLASPLGWFREPQDGRALEKDADMTGRPKRILFICGSLNQTTQMHQIAEELTDFEHAFTPYYCDGVLDWLRRARLLEFTILGFKLRQRCMDYLAQNSLPIDACGAKDGYDLVVACTDLVIPRNIRSTPLLVVQEGILDPAGIGFRVWKSMPLLPLWVAGTSTTGLSGRYERFCVASQGYRDLFVANGAPPERIVVTGIPNFDDCSRYLKNGFPHHHYVLVCSSDARETFKGDDRRVFIERCLRIAGGRPLIFKLHPNEHPERAKREIRRWAPKALVFTDGSAEEMIANCDVLITQYSSTTFVGLALGKEVHSYHDMSELRRLLPVQNGCAARNIAAVCRELLLGGARAMGGQAEALADLTPVAVG